MTQALEAGRDSARDRDLDFLIGEARKAGLLTDALPGGFAVSAGDSRAERRAQRAFDALQAFSAVYR